MTNILMFTPHKLNKNLHQWHPPLKARKVYLLSATASCLVSLVHCDLFGKNIMSDHPYCRSYEVCRQPNPCYERGIIGDIQKFNLSVSGTIKTMISLHICGWCKLL